VVDSASVTTKPDEQKKDPTSADDQTKGAPSKDNQEEAPLQVSPDSANQNSQSGEKAPESASSSGATDANKETSTPSANNNECPVVKDNAKNLTDFQSKKAKYFFNANLGEINILTIFQHLELFFL